MSITYQNLLPGWTKIPNILIGDLTCSITPYLMKEYTHCIHNVGVIFNNIVMSSRNQIECAFGRLEASWSILTEQIDLKLENIPFIVQEERQRTVQYKRKAKKITSSYRLT